MLQRSVLVAAFGLSLISPSATLASAPMGVTLGRSTVDLTGPWRFEIGDAPEWSDPSFDDSAWETVDLSAPPGAHDGDVGLTGYVPGWAAKGHKGYSGYAWYRLRLRLFAPAAKDIALAGPPAVDSAYQVFLNGALLGGSGRFSGPVPTVFSVQPRFFQLPGGWREPENRDALIAFRVWMGPWDLGDPSGGGIHIAPVLGDADSVRQRYEIQWLQTIRGYIVEILEALAFLLLAAMALCLWRFDPRNRAYPSLGIALVLLALYRTNQAAFFWGQFETVHAFEAVSVVFLIPLCLGAWTIAWSYWFPVSGAEWIRRAAALLTLCCMGGQFLTRSWFHGVLPPTIGTIVHLVIAWSRLLFVALTALICSRALRDRRDAPLGISALLLVSIGLFAQEISELGVKGIWFPFGTGVSRTQFAYAAFDLLAFALLWNRLGRFARLSAPEQ